MIKFNARTDNGVAGWLVDGHPATLKEVQTPERIAEHKRAMVLLTLNWWKLYNELKEVDQ